MISRLYTLFFIAFFTGFILLSCSGKDKALLTPQDSLKEKKLLDSFSENIQYFPEKYSEMVTDTTLSNGFRVHIKTQTDMESSVLKAYQLDSITHKNYYRNINAMVNVYKNGQQIFSQLIDKPFFYNQYSNHKELLAKMTLKVAQVNQLDDYHSDSNDDVQIEFHYSDSDEKLWDRFVLRIQENGVYNISNFVY
ncbi:MAG: hypothetical protein KDD20_08955 [Mangrovimonas sp.]|nr:hypothetical protein [Mangrovimonas sp.]MCB0438856.1 hypothetical protein [Mangrovimonas sp.]